MTKFRKYVNENFDEVMIEMERKLDKKMLSAMNMRGALLQRDLSRGMGRQIDKFKTHPDRKPKDTKITYHTWVDEWFEKEFGWRARSDHVCFVDLIDFRKSVVFFKKFAFPVKAKKAIWSNLVDDLTGELELDTRNSASKEEIFNELRDFEYKTGSLERAIDDCKHYHEIMIKCKEYYMIDFSVLKRKEIKEFLNRLGLNNFMRFI